MTIDRSDVLTSLAALAGVALLGVGLYLIAPPLVLVAAGFVLLGIARSV